MIKDVLLICGVSALGASCYYLWLMRKYLKMFDLVEAVTEMFNIGYLETLIQLPLNKYILLAGKAQHPGGVLKILELRGKSNDHLEFISSQFRYSLLTKNKEQLFIQNQPQTLIYNLKQLSDNSGVGLIHDTNIAMVGVRRPNNRFQPLVLLGENKQSLLKSLDQKILSLRNKARNLTIFGTLVVLGHGLYTRYASSKLPQ